MEGQALGLSLGRSLICSIHEVGQNFPQSSAFTPIKENSEGHSVSIQEFNGPA